MVWRMDTAPPPAPGASVVDALSLLAAVTDELLVGLRPRHARGGDPSGARCARLGLGSAAAPIETLHRGIAGAVFGGLGMALRGSSAGLDKLAATGVGPRLEEDAARPVRLLGGQRTDRRRAAPRPSAAGHPDGGAGRRSRRAGRAVPSSRRRSPTATGRLVVFLHGLCENESYWRLHRERTGTTYGEALAERGWTPVYLRANTGLPIRENGVALAALLRDVVESWPVEVERIALVGHSMGGLIMRAALNVLALDGRTDGAWADRVTDVVTLGSPHRGAPIAWGIGHGSRLLGMLPETSAFGRILDKRSEGVRDLVDGYVDELPPLKEARYRLVAATVTQSARHPVGNDRR